MKTALSDKVINRLTLYHSILTGYIGKGIENITSPQIAGLLKVDASQVRKDIKLLNNAGICKVGYSVKELKKSIEKTLGFENTKEAFIVGAGNLGLALAKYDNFAPYGLEILALFDNDPLKVGLATNNKQVFHISKLPDLTERLNVSIAVLTVPGSFAQEVADLLIESGIKYIWNFSSCILEVPPEVQVWNENLIGNFLQFTVNRNS
ncbi:MAG: redox-sensing transcriptional repressor Rex [Heliobacteriaceae bacterium]|nr:redox-sensing transcriptional repressor Rex [Heliobacteriaceae bacterium]